MRCLGIVATIFLSLGMGACGEAMPDRPPRGAALGNDGGATGNLAVPALTDDGVTGTDVHEVTKTPGGQNRMHIGRPHGQTR